MPELDPLTPSAKKRPLNRTMLMMVLFLLVAVNGALWFNWHRSNQKEAVALSIIKGCQYDAHCIGQKLAALVETHDTAYALNMLDQVVTLDVRPDSPGHTYAHEIGYATFAKYPTLPQQLSQCLDTAAGGCYHGVMMKYVSTHGIPPEETIVHVCDEMKNQRNLYKDCLHGLGHGVMMSHLMTSSKPGINDLRKALKNCDGLENTYEHYHCQRGTFMEYLIAATTHVFHYPVQPSYKPEDLHWPCSVLDRKYNSACYDYQGTYLLKQLKELKAVFTECNKASSVGNQHCAQNVGRQMNNDPAAQHSQDILEACSQALNPAQRSNCLIGAANYYLYYGQNLHAALTLCKSGITPQDDGRACVKGVLDEVQNYQISASKVEQAIRSTGVSELL